MPRPVVNSSLRPTSVLRPTAGPLKPIVAIRSLVIPLVMAAPLVLSACGGSAPSGTTPAGSAPTAGGAPTSATASSEGPVTIGVIAGVSGANSVIAPSVAQEAELAVDELNARGGILGRKVEMQVFDDGSGADGALKAFNSAVYDKKVDVIIAMETSAARNAGAPITTRAGIPFIYTSFYEGKACAENLFVDAEVPEQMAAPLVKFMREEKGANTWFLVGSDYAFGRGMLAAARKLIEDGGGTVVGDEYNPIDAADWTAILSKIRSANPDAVITSTAGGAPNVSLLKQYRGAGLPAPVGSLSLDEGTAKNIGEAAEGVYLTATYFTTIDRPENKRFLEALQKKFGNDYKTANDLSQPEYVGVHLYALAAEKAGTTEWGAIIKALPQVSFDGPSGPVQMNKQHHAALPMFLGQVQSGGTVKIIKEYGAIDPGEQCPNLKT